MSDLMEKMLKKGVIKSASILSESVLFEERDVIPTSLPILNIAFSGDVDGGLVPGLTILSGNSKTFKTMLGLYCIKAYFEKYKDSVCLLYDSEFGSTPEMLKSLGINTDRVIHIPLEHVEELKFDIVKRLESINRGDKVFILVDSLGALASKKEILDAIDEKSVADMSRAKSIRSLLRIVVPHLTTKDIPCIMINHVYQTMELYSKTIQPGGTAVTYCANQIFVITKSQEKEGTDIVGWNFNITIDKSRYVREKSKMSFTVKYKDGISKYSGLIDLAIELGAVVKPSVGWYSRVNPETGEVEEKKFRMKETSTKEFWEPVLTNEIFKESVRKRYKLGHDNILNVEDEIQ